MGEKECTKMVRAYKNNAREENGKKDIQYQSTVHGMVGSGKLPLSWEGEVEH